MAAVAVSMAVGLATSYAISLLQPTQKIESGRLDTLKVQGNTYGIPLPRLFGTVRVPGILFWAPDLVEKRVTTRSGGKGGGGGTKTVSYEYYFTGAFAIAEAPSGVSRIKSIWIDNELKYVNYSLQELASGQEIDSETLEESIKFWNDYVEFYDGLQTLPSPTIEAIEQADGFVEDLPAWTGMSYIVLRDLYRPNGTVPRVEVEVVAGESFPGPSIASVVESLAEMVNLTS